MPTTLLSVTVPAPPANKKELPTDETQHPERHHGRHEVDEMRHGVHGEPQHEQHGDTQDQPREPRCTWTSVIGHAMTVALRPVARNADAGGCDQPRGQIDLTRALVAAIAVVEV